MYEWSFVMATLEKGRVSVKVKAKSKTEAIKKGFEKIEKMGLSTTTHWSCSLIRNF